MQRLNAFVLGLIGLAALAADGPLPSPFGGPALTRDWVRSSNLASNRGSVLLLDALRAKDPVAVFRRDKAFVDTEAAAEFRMQAVGKGSRSFGIVFGATDGQTFFAFEIDRDHMKVVRFSPGQAPVTVAKRAIRDPGGRWNTARLKCTGTFFRGYFGRQVLEVRSLPGLKAGWVGAYARGGRAEVRGFRYGGKPSRLSRGWTLRPALKDTPK